MNTNAAPNTATSDVFNVSENPPIPDYLQVLISSYDAEQKTLRAKEQIPPRMKVFTFIGRVVPDQEATTHALNIGGGLFLESLEETSFDQYTDHSCDPTCRVVFDTNAEGKTVEVYMESLRTIEPGEAITFDYCTTEFDMREQTATCDFTCNCNAQNCRKFIYGFDALTREEQLMLIETHMITSPFLIQAFDSRSTQSNSNKMESVFR